MWVDYILLLQWWMMGMMLMKIKPYFVSEKRLGCKATL